jgi:hypothetical protein
MACFVKRVCTYLAQHSNTSRAGCVTSTSTPCPHNKFHNYQEIWATASPNQITPRILRESVRQRVL